MLLACDADNEVAVTEEMVITGVVFFVVIVLDQCIHTINCLCVWYDHYETQIT